MTSIKSALVLGASRGIGRQIALTLAENGYGVVVASKSTESTVKLPGSIFTVADEIRQNGGQAYPVKCDCRRHEDIGEAVKTTIEKYIS